jgi:membrane protein YdbS with pleckstrin-like domain
LPEEKQQRIKRGYLNPRVVRRIVFWTTSGCIFVAVVASLMAIWAFTGTDVLWRTVATCAVVATGMMAFFVVNSMFDWPQD